jgi:hypothetical protein
MRIDESTGALDDGGRRPGTGTPRTTPPRRAGRRDRRHLDRRRSLFGLARRRTAGRRSRRVGPGRHGGPGPGGRLELARRAGRGALRAGPPRAGYEGRSAHRGRNRGGARPGRGLPQGAFAKRGQDTENIEWITSASPCPTGPWARRCGGSDDGGHAGHEQPQVLGPTELPENIASARRSLGGTDPASPGASPSQATKKGTAQRSPSCAPGLRR